jgi:hypothetical protein
MAKRHTSNERGHRPILKTQGGKGWSQGKDQCSNVEIYWSNGGKRLNLSSLPKQRKGLCQPGIPRASGCATRVVFLQASPNLTFRDDLKQATMYVMADGTPISTFPKCVKEPSNDSSKIRFTNGLAVQVAIPDSEKSAEYTETLIKAMEYCNSNCSHPLLSLKVFIPFGKEAAIDNGTFKKLIRMQNEYIHKIIEIHHLLMKHRQRNFHGI